MFSRKKTIIILDDEYKFRDVIDEILNRNFDNKHSEVIITSDMDYVHKVISRKNGRIELFITDINHLKADVLSLCEYVKSKYPHIKVIICTAHATEQNRARGKQIADRFLIKPESKKPDSVGYSGLDISLIRKPSQPVDTRV